MAIAPRFTPSIGNVGSMPMPKAKADTSTADTFNVLAKAFGDAAKATERIASVQEAHNTAAVSHQYNLWRAKREQDRQAFAAKPFDAKTVDEDPFVKDDGADSFRAGLNEDQLKRWDQLVEVDRVKDQTWLNQYKHTKVTVQAVESLKFDIESSRPGLAMKVGDATYDSARKLHLDRVKSLALLQGADKDTAEKLAVREQQLVNYEAVKLAAEHDSDEGILLTRDLAKTSGFGLGEYTPLVDKLVKAADLRIKAKAVVDNNTRVDSDGNINHRDLIDSVEKQKVGKSQEEIEQIDVKLKERLKVESEERKSAGDTALRNLTAIVVNGVDTNEQGGKIVDQLRQAVLEHGPLLKRALPEQREKIHALLTAPEKSNRSQIIAIEAMMAAGNEGDLKASSAIMNLELEKLLLSHSDLVKVIKFREEFRAGKFDEMKAKHDSNIESALIATGVAPVNMKDILKDGVVNEEEAKKLAVWNDYKKLTKEEHAITKDYKISAERAASKKVELPGGGFLSWEGVKMDMVEAKSTLVAQYPREEVDAAFDRAIKMGKKGADVITESKKILERWEKFSTIKSDIFEPLRPIAPPNQDDSPRPWGIQGLIESNLP